jgi:hypothetical protein
MTFVMCYRGFRGLRLCCYNVPEVSESVILFAMFLTKGVTAIVIVAITNFLIYSNWFVRPSFSIDLGAACDATNLMESSTTVALVSNSSFIA